MRPPHGRARPRVDAGAAVSSTTLGGRVALVTGGNGGIGRAIAHGLARAGAAVAIAARNAAKTRAVQDEIHAAGGRAIGLECDVTDAASLDAAVRATVDQLGALTVLVNNAGVAAGGPPHAIEASVWDHVLTTNLTACFKLSQLAYPHMKAAGYGKIINIGSEYSLFGSAFVLPYATSKGGVLQLTRSLAVAWARDNIQVNALIPGWIKTDMTAAVQANETFHRRIIERTPAGRFGDAEEMAGPAVFLASPASDFVTGVALPVDGGYAVA
jgi:2-deoxy-D-gluconate 3-dehydrogenase